MRNPLQQVMMIFLAIVPDLVGNKIRFCFKAPVLFQSLGFGGEALLFDLAIIGGVLASPFFYFNGDYFLLGRRVWLIIGGILIFV